MALRVFDFREDIRNLLVTPQIRARFMRLEPGQVADRHSHDLGHEIFLILQGKGVVHLDDGDVPIAAGGSAIESGTAEAQADVTFSGLEVTLKAAGANLCDVVLVQIYLTSLAHKSVVDEVYKGYFTEPYPVRACIAVSELPTPGTVIEVVATAAVET